jgi:hypothetical protein
LIAGFARPNPKNNNNKRSEGVGPAHRAGASSDPGSTARFAVMFGFDAPHIRPEPIAKAVRT